MPTAEKQLATFLARYSPDIAAVAAAGRARPHPPRRGTVQLVYENSNARVIGFGRSERASEAICSLALYSRWVRLLLLRGVLLPDPPGLLKGEGKHVRHIV